jgi:hypothetical protein
MPAPATIGTGRLTRFAEAAFNALAPDFQFRTDTVTLSGGNLARIPNRRGADALVMTAGTLAAPAPDPIFGGHPSLSFAGAQYLDSDMTPAAWSFTNDGTAFDGFMVFSLPTPASNQTLVGTTTGSTSGKGFRSNMFSGTLSLIVGNGGSGHVNRAAGSPLSNKAYYHHFYVNSANALQALSALNANVGSAGSYVGGAPAAGAPLGTLRLGADSAGANWSTMRFVELILFKRLLTEYQHQVVREYLAERYGIAAPALDAPTRKILRLVPRTFIDPAYYATVGGKVSALLDRAMPGHSFSQAAANQQVPIPLPDAAMNGALSLAFAGGQSYASSFPGSAWTYLYQANATAYTLSTTTDFAISRVIVGNRTGTAPDWRAYSYASTIGGGPAVLISSNSSTPYLQVTGGATVLGAPQMLRITNDAAAIYLHEAAVKLAELTGVVYPTVASVSTLALGSSNPGALQGPHIGTIGGVVLFDRMLSAADAATFSEASLEKWGRAA